MGFACLANVTARMHLLGAQPAAGSCDLFALTIFNRCSENASSSSSRRDRCYSYLSVSASDLTATSPNPLPCQSIQHGFKTRTEGTNSEPSPPSSRLIVRAWHYSWTTKAASFASSNLSPTWARAKATTRYEYSIEVIGTPPTARTQPSLPRP